MTTTDHPFTRIATVTYRAAELVVGDCIVETFNDGNELSLVRSIELPTVEGAVVVKLVVDVCTSDDYATRWTHNVPRWCGIDARFNIIGNPR